MADVVVVGSGIAGLFVATRCARAGLSTLVVTKKNLSDSSTNWAQGGIAAAMSNTDYDAHIADTIEAGCGLSDPRIVEMVIREASDRIEDLIASGVQFDTNEDGFDLAMEGGHSSRRILHSKDATGAEIERALIVEARASPNLELLEDHMAVDLILADKNAEIKRISGIWVLTPTGEVRTISAQAIIIAAGGAGHIYRQTTNPSVATGDGIAMAHRAGAKVRDLEFVQFHPTALALYGERPFLISEALRGHGAILMTSENMVELKNGGGEPAQYSFMLHHDPRGSLATRDIVARAADQVMKKTGENCVWLVTSHLDSQEIQERFPTIQSRLKTHGLTLGIDALPVAPAAHYMVGGISVDENGLAKQCPACSNEVQYPGLYSIGEVACTGLHGANRLASNSLLEAVVFSHRCAEHVIANVTAGEGEMSLPEWRADGLSSLVEHAPLKSDRIALQSTMTDDVGLVKRNARLQRAQRRLDFLREEVDRIWRGSLPTREVIELRNMIHVSRLVTSAAINRKENIGLHHNLDCD
ncbi:MAG: L-aspartate oxidase [Candidatus Thalassarchaeaceae archaeon]|nr:L-aspartate oxidase [Candidatus Thalassarchaeaceae archaeon]